MKKAFSVLLALAALASCTFKQQVAFNKNWSGEMSCVIDMSEMSTLLESSGDPMDFMEESDSKSKISRLKQVPGIKKVKVRETSNGIYKITYSFNGLKALNTSGNILFSDEKSLQDFTYFTLKDAQTLHFTMPFSGVPVSEEESAENSIGENFIYELTLAFPKKIKNLETKTAATLSEDRKQVVFKTDMMSLTTTGFEPGLLIQFEK